MNLALPFAAPFPRGALPRFRAPVACPATAIAKRSCLNLGNAEGRTITCLRGAVWLTHDGDCRDVVLQAGQSHKVDRSTRLIAQGLEDALVRVA